jgi:LEA14-like dessication related protein
MKKYLSAIGIIAVTITSCTAPRPLIYKDVCDFKLDHAGLSRSSLSLNIKLYNPNHFGLKLKQGLVNLYLNDSHLGVARVERNSVPANDTFLLPIAINVDMSSLLSNSMQLLTKKEVTFKLEGVVKAGNHGLYIKVPLRYEGKQKIRK